MPSDPTDANLSHHYAIRGGVEGKKRLEAIGRTHWPGTKELLQRAGLTPGMHCLDLGCGPGLVTLELASRVGPSGSVIGIDADPVKLDLARQAAAARGLTNIEFLQRDVATSNEVSRYDLLYSRFLFTHLSFAAALAGKMLQAARPNGIAIVEDTDFSGLVTYPHSPAIEQYVSWYRQVVANRGGDADIGPRLYRLLVDAGWQNLEVTVSQPAFSKGEGKRNSWTTLQNIKESIFHDRLASAAEIDQTLDDMARFIDDPSTIVTAPRIFQVIGYKNGARGRQLGVSSDDVDFAG
jgi:ubiquinone/menaquinone biosynthesis C-methylase UbiE